jgi:biotin-dependent carboxylase-like uncharacterized protein
MTGALRIETAGNAVVTDLGRSRGPAMGLPMGGASDQYSARVANILVANADEDPVIEVTAFDLSFVAEVDLLIAVTGAPMTLLVDDVERSMWEPVSIDAGQRVTLTEMSAGLRTYVAVHGAFDVPLLLGSCAPDSGVGFGIRLSPGGRLEVRTPTGPVVNPYFDMSLFNLGVLIPYFGDDAVVKVTDGPDQDDFAGTAGRLFQAPYTVTAKSNHIGLRMTGRLPVRTSTSEVLSRGVPIGAVEVPPGDELVVLHRGRGVTAGYPVLAVVAPVSLDDLGQVRPGQHVCFRHISVEHAAQDVREWHLRLEQLRRRVATIYSSLGIGELLGIERVAPPHLPLTAARDGSPAMTTSY